MDQNELPLEPHQQWVPSGATKTITEPMVHLAQTLHLSWVKINNISKQTEMSFHLSLVTEEYHWVHPKWFLTLWYIWRNPCTYLRLQADQNKILHDPRHLGGPLGASKLSLWYVQRKPCTYLASRLALSPNGPKWASTWASSPRSTIRSF
jgi:hypothetical protein